MRLILDKPRSAALNMAIDEMLMHSPPCLRIYSWEVPSISIGYFQDVAEAVRGFQCEKRNIPVVRRITGGGLVFHGDDLTFSLSLKPDNSFLPKDVKQSYLKVAEAVRVGLKDSYPGLDYAECRERSRPFSTHARQADRICFQEPSCYDLMWNGKKIMGASQRRFRASLLHQATVFLPENKQTLIEKIIDGFKRSWKISFEHRPLTEAELEKAKKIGEDRYFSSEWAFDPDYPIDIKFQQKYISS